MFALRVSKPLKYAYGIAVAMWLACLALPAAEINGSMRIAGYRAFTLGIDALSSGIFGWLANPLALAAVIAGLLDRFLIATLRAGGACILSLTSFLAPEIARADGVPIEEVAFKAGFFLWLAACLVIFATSGYALIRSKRPDQAR